MLQSTIINKMPKGDNRGFTLIEAMIALLVFTIGILAMVSLQTRSLDANTHAQQVTEAATLGVSALEALYPLDYLKDAELSNGTHAMTLPNQGQYAITYNIQRDAVLDNTMLIQVNVTWMLRGVQRSVNLIAIKPDII